MAQSGPGPSYSTTPPSTPAPCTARTFQCFLPFSPSHPHPHTRALQDEVWEAWCGVAKRSPAPSAVLARRTMPLQAPERRVRRGGGARRGGGNGGVFSHMRRARSKRNANAEGDLPSDALYPPLVTAVPSAVQKPVAADSLAPFVFRPRDRVGVAGDCGRTMVPQSALSAALAWTAVAMHITNTNPLRTERAYK